MLYHLLVWQSNKIVERRINGTLKRSIHHKPIWVGQYTHFSNFVPLQHKRNLVRCLVQRARNICTDDTLDDELAFIHNTLRLNGYPDRFIDKAHEINASQTKQNWR